MASMCVITDGVPADYVDEYVINLKRPPLGLRWKLQRPIFSVPRRLLEITQYLVYPQLMAKGESTRFRTILECIHALEIEEFLYDMACIIQ
jgi:hypothetical protein